MQRLVAKMPVAKNPVANILYGLLMICCGKIVGQTGLKKILFVSFRLRLGAFVRPEQIKQRTYLKM